MTISPFLIYVFSVLDKFHIFMALMAIVTGVLSGFALIAILCIADDSFTPQDEKNEHIRGALKFFKHTIIAFVIFSIFTIFSPTKETVVAMYIIPSVANGRLVQKDIPAIYDKFITKFLEEDKKKNED